MDVTVCESHVVAVAASVNGEETEVPLTGLLMARFEVVVAGCVGCVEVVDDVEEVEPAEPPPLQPATMTTGATVIASKKFRRRFIQGGPFRFEISPIRSGPGFVNSGKAIAAPEGHDLCCRKHCRVAS